MASHVATDAAALPGGVPEPALVRASVLLCTAGQVGMPMAFSTCDNWALAWMMDGMWIWFSK